MNATAPSPTDGARDEAAPAQVRAAAEEVELATLAKALGHPARVRILRFLLSSDACMCGEIVEVVPLAQSTVSQHLKVLKQAGLIVGEIDGPRVCYSPDLAVVARLRQLVGCLQAPEATDAAPGGMDP